ncbi:type II toxin-antitoxin system RelE family toxin [Herbiconiux sp. YIM B11900]|uniref:type II toxin-antitoxin system RelE family toxin n=1 Tax=Herbiconiux sp. YIM B11900 TaxID=3404131 RepID=UPI003F84E29E
MSRWSVETSAEFDRRLRKLDRTIASRLTSYLDELAGLDDPRSRGKGLTGALTGVWRYRIGDYRLLAEVQDERLVIFAFEFVHRSEAY